MVHYQVEDRREEQCTPWHLEFSEIIFTGSEGELFRWENVMAFKHQVKVGLLVGSPHASLSLHFCTQSHQLVPGEVCVCVGGWEGGGGDSGKERRREGN